MIVEAVIVNKISTEGVVITTTSSDAFFLPDTITSTAVINGLMSSCVTLTTKVDSCAVILNSGINSEPCPIILCVDGGDAFTIVYPPVNGLLNGGSA